MNSSEGGLQNFGARARKIVKFRREVARLSDEVISNPYLMNCEAAANLLLRHRILFSAVLLCAVDKSKRYTLRSLSYFLNGREIRMLPDYPAPLTGLNAQLRALRSGNTKRIKFSGNNSDCTFLVNEEFFGDEFLNDIKAFSHLYDHMVVASHNYRNYVSGEIYFHAKPDKKPEKKEEEEEEKDAPYPRFESIEQICSSLSEISEVEARHFVYIGTRRPNVDNIESEFLTYDQETIPKFCKQTALDEGFLRDLRSVIALRQSRMGKLTRGRKSFYAVFPVYDPNVQGRPQGAVVMLSSKPLGLLVMRAAEEWLSTFSSKRHVIQASVLSSCLKKAEAQIGVIGAEATLRQRLDCFGMVADELAKHICSCTYAASVTIRRIDHTRGVLARVGSHQSKWGPYFDAIVKEKRDVDIPLNMTTTSFNAFAASYPRSDKVLHIEDIDSIPREYRENGLRQILMHHQFTRTEAVARVIAGKSLVAVMNIEGPISGSLREHISFFGQCADFLGALHQRLFSLSDSLGLASMAKYQVKLHSVTDMLRRWIDGDSKGALQIVRQLKELEPKIAEQEQKSIREISFPEGPDIGTDVQVFNASLRSWVNYLLRAKFGGQCDFDSKAIIGGRVPRHFDPDLIPSLFVIMISILENFIFKISWEKHQLQIKDEFVGFPSTRRLSVVWTSREPMNRAVDRNAILLKPLKSGSGSHFGFFLIGVHARQQGGSAEFVDICDTRDIPVGFSLTVSLPYEPQGPQLGRRGRERG